MNTMSVSHVKASLCVYLIFSKMFLVKKVSSANRGMKQQGIVSFIQNF